MTNAAILTAVAAALTPLVEAAGGRLEQAQSMDEAAAYLAGAPNGWRVIVVWPGYGSHPAAREGMAYHQVTTIVQAPRGLPAHVPDGLNTISGQVEQVSAWMRGLRFGEGWDVDEAGFALENSVWLDTHATARAHAMTWQLAGALPPFSTTIPIPLPTL